MTKKNQRVVAEFNLPYQNVKCCISAKVHSPPKRGAHVLLETHQIHNSPRGQYIIRY